MIGRNWVLVRSGMDDFRSGKPLDFKEQFAVDVGWIFSYMLKIPWQEIEIKF